MRVHFLSVGQGDCTLIEFPDGKTMLVDGGSPYGDSVKTVMRYLNALKIKTLDYVVATDTETNRCGALAEVARYKKIGFVYYPKAKGSGSLEYNEFSAEVGRKETPATTAERYLRIEHRTQEGAYSFMFLLPNSKAETGETALWVEWQGYGVLLFGALSESTETQLYSDMRLGYFDEYELNFEEKTYLVRMQNNGAATDTTKDLFAYLRPQAVVISCLQSVSFTPDEWAIPQVSESYRTDLQGTVVASITKNGLSVTVATEK